MRLKSPFLFLVLLGISYITFIHPTKIIKPFYYLKDLVFTIVHANTKTIALSKEMELSIIDNLKEDIHNLEKLNKINLSVSDFEMINATIISRNREYWFNTLTINKGSSDGIEIDMAVIDSDGLIGRINMVTENTSTVKLITTNDTKNKVSAVINNKDDKIYGIINGYDSGNNLLHITITDNEKIEEGSIVQTTGMGGVFPSGILIGKVYDTIKKDDDITNIVRIKPSSNIEGERYVIVLKRKEISTS